MKRKISWYCVFCLAMPLLIAVACHNVQTSEPDFRIGEAAVIEGLHAPWDGLDDETDFICMVSPTDFHFEFDVVDTTLTLAEDFRNEKDVELEDRVELFFSPEANMDQYWCAEMDPSGQVMDYSCEYYRKMDYGWNFKSLKIFSTITSYGYHLSGKISLKELEELGIQMEKGFYMGVFRADYRAGSLVNWYSHVETDDKSPDFHKPEMLFFAKR